MLRLSKMIKLITSVVYFVKTEHLYKIIDHLVIAKELKRNIIDLEGHDLIAVELGHTDKDYTHSTEVKRLVVMEIPPPGFFPSPSVNGGPLLWWVIFHQTPDVPEALVQGKEMIYLPWFYHNLAYNPAAIAQAAINEYVSHYSAPGRMRAGFEYYRAFPQDAIQNMNYSKTKLIMPVLALGGGYIPTFGGNITMPTIIYGMKLLAQNVQGIKVPNSGHFIPEERPDFVIKTLDNFLGGNTSKTK